MGTKMESQVRCLPGWYQTHEGREIMMSLMERNLQRRKMFGLLEQPNFPGRQNVQSTGTVHKVLVLGKSAVGKTSVVCRLAGAAPPKSHCETPGIQVSQVYWPIKISGSDSVVVFHLEFWDAGEAALKKFDHVAPVCHEGVDVALIVFSFADKNSFLDIPPQLDKIGDLPSLVVGTKSDLGAAAVEVTASDISELEESRGISVIRLSTPSAGAGNTSHQASSSGGGGASSDATDLLSALFAEVHEVAPVLCRLCEILCSSQPAYMGSTATSGGASGGLGAGASSGGVELISAQYYE